MTICRPSPLDLGPHRVGYDGGIDVGDVGQPPRAASQNFRNLRWSRAYFVDHSEDLSACRLPLYSGHVLGELDRHRFIIDRHLRQVSQRLPALTEAIVPKELNRTAVDALVDGDPIQSQVGRDLLADLKSAGADLKHVREPVDVEEARVLDTDPQAPEVYEESQEPER